MRVYLSGKITGLPDLQVRAQFARSAERLQKAGFETVNPMELDHTHDQFWESYMRVDLQSMLTCDAIYMMPGWEHSRGAKLEYELAKELNFHFIF